MSDMRKPLPNGFSLNCDGKSYIICNEIDRGASCIVYNALYSDEVNRQHYVRIKELYPYHLRISRSTDQSLVIADTEKFAEEEEHLVTAYKHNSDLKQVIGMTNSTVNPIGIFKANNTRYIITDCIEGKSYCEECDKDIHTVFVRMLALAKIVREYHKNGFLHLDIKPSNILVIPETAEHIYLFDFDSLQLKSDIRDGNAKKFSFTNGFSAPELIYGKSEKLCDATDFYSVGAVIYYKLFGTAPDFSAFSISSKIDFSLLKFKGENPDLIEKLAVFFRKTLTASPLSRFKTDDELIYALKELVRLSDTEKPYLMDSFTYISENFVGREKEITALDKGIKNNHAVFVSGIGGIGKTELVRWYAHTHRDKFRRIIFASYTGNIKSTFCKNEIFIKNFKRGTDENDEDFYTRKLSVFSELTNENDLFILDNFDTDNCDEILELLNCRCKFIVTSRNDFRDYNMFQINIRSIDNMGTLLKLFRIYNPSVYSDEEKEFISALIELVERHTMSVELIAKYLRITQSLPSKLFADIAEKEGITNTDSIRIKQRKDNRMCSSDIVTHLLSIFNLYGFSESQCEVIKSLSLLGYVKIRREKFFELCPVSSCIEDVEQLVKSGWIQSDDPTGKIHLHQIILDLVYNELKPTTNSCPHITAAMDNYLLTDFENRLESDIRSNIAKNFVDRISGTSLAYAKLLTDYCYKINAEKSLLEKAESVCISSVEPNAQKLMYRIYIKQIELFTDDDRHLFDEDFSEDDLIENVIEVCNKAFTAAENLSAEPCFISEASIEISDVICEAAESAFLLSDANRIRLLDTAEEFIIRAENFISDDMTCEQKIKLYTHLQDFYADNDPMHWFRSKHFADNSKVLHYQQIINNLSEQEEDYIYTSESYEEAAFHAMINGEYYDAIELYETALKEPGYSSYADEQLADCYIAVGEPLTAINRLKEIVERRGTEWGGFYSCSKLIKISFDNGYYEDCRKYSQLLLSECPEMSNMQIIGNYYLYKLEDDEGKRKALWDKCCSLFENLDFVYLHAVMEDFLIEYSEKFPDINKRLELLTECARYINMYTDNCRIYKYIFDLCDGKKELARFYTKALLQSACRLFRKEDEVLSLCKKAESIFLSSGIDDEIFKNEMYCIMGECLENRSFSLISYAEEAYRKCDLYLLAKHKSMGSDDEKMLEIWTDTLEKYKFLEQYAMSEKCCDMIMQVIRRNINRSEFCYYTEISGTIYEIIECLGQTQNHGKIRQLLSEIYPQILYYYDNIYDGEKTEIPERCAGDIHQLAFYANNSDEKLGSLILNLASVIILTGENADAMSVQKAMQNDTDSFKSLVSRFKEALEMQLTSQQVDNIIEVKKSIEEKSEFVAPDILDALEHFSAVYERSDIEFKR